MSQKIFRNRFVCIRVNRGYPSVQKLMISIIFQFFCLIVLLLFAHCGGCMRRCCRVWVVFGVLLVGLKESVRSKCFLVFGLSLRRFLLSFALQAFRAGALGKLVTVRMHVRLKRQGFRSHRKLLGFAGTLLMLSLCALGADSCSRYCP